MAQKECMPSINGFSEDGYIIDQNLIMGPYREMTSNVNGCGWIASFNLRHALGHEVEADEVRRELDGMIRLRVPGPTPLRALRTYLERYVTVRASAAGPAECLEILRDCRAGILRYWEGKDPHYIAFLRQPDGRYRYFNVADGEEDIYDDMPHFFEKHVTKGAKYIRAFAIE